MTSMLTKNLGKQEEGKADALEMWGVWQAVYFGAG